MSNKHTCPACQSHLSSIYDVLTEGAHPDACPHCGLPGETLREIHRVREGHANAAVKAEFEALAIRAGRAEAEAAKFKAKLDRIQAYFAGFNWDGAEEEWFGD